MAPRIEHLKTELIERVAKIVQSKLKNAEAAAAERFVRAFYRNVPPTDIAQQSPEALYGVALSFLAICADQADPAAPHPGIQPAARVAWLEVEPYGDRGGER